ncbi:hypothetical protein, partial [Klebsiella pneumoniae]|uniref:hypothetical protein n=1 Tax=Klebsiella pneumoniae TaxID=573 RepID=UPI0024DEDD2A
MHFKVENGQFVRDRGADAFGQHLEDEEEHEDEEDDSDDGRKEPENEPEEAEDAGAPPAVVPSAGYGADWGPRLDHLD